MKKTKWSDSVKVIKQGEEGALLYLYHLNIISELTIDEKTSRAVAKIRDITRRYLQYRFKNQPSCFSVVQNERSTLRRSGGVA